MRSMMFLVILLFATTLVARTSRTGKYEGEYYCNVYQVVNNQCHTGDLIISIGDSESIIAQYCDFQYPVYTTGSGVVCNYIGYTRVSR